MNFNVNYENGPSAEANENPRKPQRRKVRRAINWSDLTLDIEWLLNGLVQQLAAKDAAADRFERS